MLACKLHISLSVLGHTLTKCFNLRCGNLTLSENIWLALLWHSCGWNRDLKCHTPDYTIHTSFHLLHFLRTSTPEAINNHLLQKRDITISMIVAIVIKTPSLQSHNECSKDQPSSAAVKQANVRGQSNILNWMWQTHVWSLELYMIPPPILSEVIPECRTKSKLENYWICTPQNTNKGKDCHLLIYPSHLGRKWL